MDENPSYVFFREVRATARSAPKARRSRRGAASRSIRVPAARRAALARCRAGRRFACAGSVVAQDTGGAIRGPVRGDLFFGFGEAAEAQAGRMRARGAYYMLLPLGVAPKRQTIAAAGRVGIDFLIHPL